MTLVANARMYTVDATVDALWRDLFAWVSRHASVELDVVPHSGALSDLWRRDDLGAATMCGYPLATWRQGARPVPLAAPVPKQSRAAVYHTDIVVRADSSLASDDDLAGMRFGWTVVDSQSGYQAPRRHFAARAIARGGRFFASTLGPLVTPRRIVEAVLAGTIDGGPLDAYWHALLRRHEPKTAAQLRTVATTPPTPIPCFVAAAATAPGLRERLARVFVDATSATDVRPTLDALELRGFERVDATAYDVLAAQARDVDTRGYTELG